jgi:hypothetical protein
MRTALARVFVIVTLVTAVALVIGPNVYYHV